MRHSSWRSVSVLLTPGVPTRSNSKSTVNTSDEPTPRIEVTIPTPQLDIPLPKRQYEDTYGDDHTGPIKPNRTYRIHDIEKTSSETGLFPASSSVYSSAGSYSPPISALAVRAPDGGGVAWATALAGFLVAFNCWGLNFAFGVLEPWYRSSLLAEHAASRIAWIGSTQMALLFLVAPLASLLYDYGYFRFLFNGGTILLLGACLATSWCRTWVTLFVAQGLVTGIANGMVFCSGVRVLMGLFDKRVGLAFGIGAMGASVGGIVFTLAVQYMLPETGFGSTYRVLTLIVLVTMLFPTLVVKPWAGECRTAKEKVRLGIVFLDGAFWVMILGMFFAFWGLYFGYYYVTSYAAASLRTSASASSHTTTVTTYLLTMLAANLPGRLLPALLSDTLSGPLNALFPCALSSAALLYSYIPARSSSAALYTVSALYGFASGGIMSLYAAVGRQWDAIPTTSPTPPPTASTTAAANSSSTSMPSCNPDSYIDFGAGNIAPLPPLPAPLSPASRDAAAPLRTAIVLVAAGCAALTGPPLGGHLLDVGQEREGAGPEGFVIALAWAGGSMAAAALCFAVARVMRVGFRWARA
ncbi:major facilitator superfamily domain-containing protein [Phyllosticta citribraziliensis]|uniref:Major facilitator superfamily domain-containing protein n=1 Tax=Phyllosticta citribraziliensis TaxID=989973 RepID=A0ABR1M585_9PEZI